MLVIKQFGPVTYAMGTLQEILAGTGIAAKVRALPNDVAGCTLEMSADGLWTGNLGTLTQAQADALVAAGVMASVKAGVPAQVDGVQTIWSDVDTGWVDAGIETDTQSKIKSRIRSAVSRTIAGASDMRIVSQGDSISRGAQHTAKTHFSRRYAEAVAAKYGLQVGEGYICLDNSNSPTPISTVTVGSGWGVFSVYPLFKNGMQTAPVGTATSLDVAIAEVIDSVNIVWHTGGGSTGDLVYSWDGGAKVTIANPGGAYAYTRTNIAAPTRGVHTLNLWQPASGNKSYYFAVEPQDSTIRKVRAVSSGFSGAPVAALSGAFKPLGTASEPDCIAVMQTDVLIVEIGTNDQIHVSGYLNGQAWQDSLANIITQQAQRNTVHAVTCIHLSPANTINSGSYTPSVSAFVGYSSIVCRQKSAISIDLASRWVDYSTANSNGYFIDGLHPNFVGSVDIGVLLSDLTL